MMDRDETATHLTTDEAAARAEGVRAPDDRPARMSSAEPANFPVVGLGASAGGLRALEEFLEHVPPDSGMAFIVATHQQHQHTSVLAQLLGRKTTMPVTELSESTTLEPNHVYTVQPGHVVSFANGQLDLAPAQDSEYQARPIDHFFDSLARAAGTAAIAIVLSGTGSDGSGGIRAIRAHGGMVMAQDPASAQFAGMPTSAIETSLVDHVLPPGDMAKPLIAHAQGLALRDRSSTPRSGLAREDVDRALELVRQRTGHDFARYKRNTVTRRIERRLQVHRLHDLPSYVSLLQDHPEESETLFRELLIGVTSFFRDNEAWDALFEAVIALLRDKPDDYVVRAWVPGCSTGEEAYSLALLLREAMDALKRTLSVQIFATDLDAAAIEFARSGAYPPSIAKDVSPRRLSRFFTQEESTYRVKKEIREMLVFAPHNLIGDPPFTKLDLLCCRNLLIYLDVALQRQVLPTFHYALKPQGLLFLGPSESLGNCSELFVPLEKRWRIFRRNDTARAAYADTIPSAATRYPMKPHATTSSASVTVPLRMDQTVEKALVRELVPPTVLIHERGDVVHVHGRTGSYLEPAEGPQGNANLFDMARPGLRLLLTSAVRQAAATGQEVTQRGLQLETDSGIVTFDLRVARLMAPELLQGLFRISFENGHVGTQVPTEEAEDQSTVAHRLLELERELQYSKADHQQTIEELEAANEEFKSFNEEMQSTNEELQSANEELETSKEEMQSLNEELQTVNTELQDKVLELSRANDDMKNLLNATDIGTVFLDNELRITRYTEQAKRVIRLIPTDLGRPISDLVSSLHYDRLVEDAEDVLRNLLIKEAEVRSEHGEWYLMRMLPYRTTDNVIDGLVMTFVDITGIKELKEEQRRLLEALKNSPASVFGQDRDLRFTWVCNPLFGQPPEALVGKTDFDLFPHEDAERLVELKRQVLEGGTPLRRRVNVTIGGKRHHFDVYVEPKRSEGTVIGVSCVAVDVEASEPST